MSVDSAVSSRRLLLYADRQDDQSDRLLLNLLAQCHPLPAWELTLLTSAVGSSHAAIQVASAWDCPEQTIEWLRQQSFAAALIFTNPGRSPYSRAYLCYLAGIAIRLGASCEFGGGVLSHCFSPPETVSIADSIRYLLHSSLEYLCGYEF